MEWIGNSGIHSSLGRLTVAVSHELAVASSWSLNQGEVRVYLLATLVSSQKLAASSPVSCEMGHMLNVASLADCYIVKFIAFICPSTSLSESDAATFFLSLLCIISFHTLSSPVHCLFKDIYMQLFHPKDV